MNKQISKELAIAYASCKLSKNELISNAPNDLEQFLDEFTDAYCYFRNASFTQSQSSDKYISELSSADAPED